MSRRRRHRALIVLLLVVSLLSQQLAMAGHGCTMSHAPADPVAVSHDCAGMLAEQGPSAHSLCEKHCASDSLLVNSDTAPCVPALGLPPVVHDLGLVIRIADTFVPDFRVTRTERPPRLRYCRLLI